MRKGVPQRVLIVTNDDRPPIAISMAKAFERQGVKPELFYQHFCNTLYDRLIIHTVNHYAHTLRLVPKTVDLFEGHPWSHKEFRCRELIKRCHRFQPELIILTRGLRLKMDTIRELRKISTLFCWYMESEKRFAEIEPEIPLYHHTYFFSSRSLNLAQQRGFEAVSLLQHAVDLSQFYPLNIKKKKYDWCFVGSWTERRQKYIEGLAKVSRNFVFYGPSWPNLFLRDPRLWLRRRGEGIWGGKLTRLYNQSKVVINVSVWGDEERTGRGANMRLLEVPACRSCLLTDYASDAEMLLTPGEDFVVAITLSEMQEKLAWLLREEQRREQIAQRGYEKVCSVRTFDDLAAEIIADWAQRQDIPD